MAAKPRLLVVGPIPPPLSGPEIVTRNLIESRALRERYEVIHLNTTVRKSNQAKGKLDSLMVWAFISYVFRFIRCLVIMRPDYVLYLPTSATLKGWTRDGMTMLLSRPFGAKLVVLFQGGHFRYFYDSLRGSIQTLIGWLIRRSHLVLAQADTLKRQFAGIVPEPRVGTLFNSIDTKFFDAFESTPRCSGSPVNVLFVGHLSYAKGYCDLLRTLPDLAARYAVRIQCMGVINRVEHNVFFNQMTGERLRHEDPQECFEKYIEVNGLARHVKLLGGQVHGADKIKVFREADIFVLPSYSEGFSTAILEAMAAGLPVVVTRVGAAPDVIQDNVNGYVIPPGDVDALRDRLERLIVDRDLRLTMGRNNREKCRSEFLVDASAERLSRLLESIG